MLTKKFNLIKLSKWEFCDFCNTKQYKGKTVRLVGDIIQCLPCKAKRDKWNENFIKQINK